MTEKTFECAVSADLFRRVMLGVSTDECRYYLNGVHVSPCDEGGAVLTATDGHLLISMHDPDAICTGNGIVQINKALKAALKASGVMIKQRLLVVREVTAAHRAFVVDVNGKTASDPEYSPYAEALAVLDAPDSRVIAAQFGACTIDGTFPDWRRVIPAKLRPDAPVPSLDHALVARVAEAVCLGKSRKVRLTASGDNPSADPVFVTSFDKVLAAFAVVMPIRDDAASSVPSWATRKDAPAIAAE